MLAIVAAVEKEVSLLINFLKNIKTLSLGKRQFYQGRFFKQEVVIATTGIGAVNAAYTLTLLAEYLSLDFVLATGCAGAFPQTGLNIGDIAVATSEIWAEAGAYTDTGWHSLEKINLPLYQKHKTLFYNVFEVPKKVKEISSLIFNFLPKGVGYKKGPFLTVSATTGSQERLYTLKRHFPEAICENMEGAAVAQICTIYDLPWFECRGISNLLGEYDKSKWNIDLAAKHSQLMLLNLIKEPALWKP